MFSMKAQKTITQALFIIVIALSYILIKASFLEKVLGPQTESVNENGPE